jgi:hypothetical protein
MAERRDLLFVSSVAIALPRIWVTHPDFKFLSNLTSQTIGDN